MMAVRRDTMPGRTAVLGLTLHVAAYAHDPAASRSEEPA